MRPGQRTPAGYFASIRLTENTHIAPTPPTRELVEDYADDPKLNRHQRRTIKSNRFKKSLVN